MYEDISYQFNNKNCTLPLLMPALYFSRQSESDKSVQDNFRTLPIYIISVSTTMHHIYRELKIATHGVPANHCYFILKTRKTQFYSRQRDVSCFHTTKKTLANGSFQPLLRHPYFYITKVYAIEY